MDAWGAQEQPSKVSAGAGKMKVCDCNVCADAPKMKVCDSVFTVTKEHWLPRWDMDINPIDWDIRNRPMRQDRPATYVEAGMFYITTKERLVSSGLRYSGDIGVVELPLKDSLQIDSQDDLSLIKQLMKI